MQFCVVSESVDSWVNGVVAMVRMAVVPLCKFGWYSGGVPGSTASSTPGLGQLSQSDNTVVAVVGGTATDTKLYGDWWW